MGDYSKKTQGSNRHLADLTSARWVHIDGSVTSTKVVRPKAGRLLKITVNAKGVGFTIANGSETIATFATTTVEGDYSFGVYCDANITITGITGTGSTTIVFDE